MPPQAADQANGGDVVYAATENFLDVGMCGRKGAAIYASMDEPVYIGSILPRYMYTDC